MASKAAKSKATNNKRTKLEALIHEELSGGAPPSYASHYASNEDGKPAVKPQDKRIATLLEENLKALSVTATAGGTSTKSTAAPPMEGDLPSVSLHKAFFVQGIKIGWPFPAIMPPQRQIALHLIKALKSSKHVVLESPTGTGKSAAILCSVLAWQRHHSQTTTATSEHNIKIIYCSRTHSQVAQMVSSLRKTPYRPKMAVLGSRDRLCINDVVLNGNNNTTTECRLRVSNTEKFRKKAYQSQNKSYDDENPPTDLEQDVMESGTTLPVEDNGDDDDGEGPKQSSKSSACCSYYRQLGPKRTAELVSQAMAPSACDCTGAAPGVETPFTKAAAANSKQGGAATKHGTHDIEDLKQFCHDPYLRQDLALYRNSPTQKVGLHLIENSNSGRSPYKYQIGSVAPNSPADGLLKPGEWIVSIQGQAIGISATLNDVAQRMGQHNPLLLDVTSHPDLVVSEEEDDDNDSPHAPCPYYLSRALAKHAELLFCPYNYILDPHIRTSLGIDLEKNIVVLDEAHNVEDVLRDSGSGKFGEVELCEMVVMLQFFSSGESKQVLRVDGGAAEFVGDEGSKALLTECAHELLLFLEKIMHYVMEQKMLWEKHKSQKVLEDWRRFKTSDETEFDMTFHGPTGHGVKGKAVGCAPFFESFKIEPSQADTLRNYAQAIDNYVRSQQDFLQDKHGTTLDRMNELILRLSYALQHAPHFYIASVAKANGSLSFAATGQHDGASRFTRKPSQLPYMPPRSGGSPNVSVDVCKHQGCRGNSATAASNFVNGVGSGYVRHGDYCNGSKPAWEGVLVVECLTPAPFFKDLREQCRTVVLASGSLAPISSLCAELGLAGVAPLAKSPMKVSPVLPQKRSVEADDEKKKEPVGRLQIQPKPLEANHVIDLNKQLRAVSVGFFPDGSPLTVNYANTSKPDFVAKLGDAVATVVESIPTGGVLVFLPSYSLLRKCVGKWNPTLQNGQWSNFGGTDTQVWDRFVASKGRVIVEPTGSQSQFEEARDEYARIIAETGKCILLAVFRGKMSEGISFNDANARGVICIGIPFPNSFARSIKAKKTYNDEQRKVNKRTDILSGNEWYSQQAYRAIAQALGRCIRHAADYGTVVLLDSRHCDDDGQTISGSNVCLAHRRLPKWMRHTVKNLSRSRQGDLYTNSIPGGWSGLEREYARFFAQAPIHSQTVLNKQRENLEKSQAAANETSHTFDAKTGKWDVRSKENSNHNQQQVQTLMATPRSESSSSVVSQSPAWSMMPTDYCKPGLR